MKRTKWLAALAVLLGLPLFVWVGLSRAQYITTYVDQGQTVNSSIYSAGKEVTIHGTINGDVYCAGQSVTIDATVHGDVLCAGMDVTVAGKVDGNVRLAGQTVSVSAEVARNATVAASNFSLDMDAVVKGDVTALGNVLNVKGSVGRDAVLAGTTLTLNGPVGRDVQASGQSVTLKPNANISGSLTYTSKQNANISASAVVKGDTTHKQPKPGTREHRSWAGISIYTYLYMLAALGLIAVCFAAFFPRWTNGAGEVALKRPGMVFLVGFLANLIAPVVIFSLMLTFVGIPLALVLMLIWMVVLVAAGPLTAYWLGRVILQKRAKHVVLVMVTGSVVLLTLYFVPFVGALFFLAAVWLGTGMLLMYLKGHLPKAQYKL